MRHRNNRRQDMSMCDHLQAALEEARHKGNPELAGMIEKALALAGCQTASLDGDDGGGNGNGPP
jgi:hypothetical protein